MARKTMNRLVPLLLLSLMVQGCYSLSTPPQAPGQTQDKIEQPTLTSVDAEGVQTDDPGIDSKIPGTRQPEFSLDDFTVTATRTSRRDFDTPRALTHLDQEEVDHKNQASVVDALNDRIGVWVEKRTTTTSDPVIRGFAGGNLLALVDGNSLTTLWGEGGYAGDDMYGKVDGESIGQIEVIRGPTSVLYGSNALGGVINFITKSSPIDYQESGFDWGGQSKASYGSAADEIRLRQEFYGASERFKFFLGGTVHNGDDVEGGRGVGTMTPTSGKDYSYDFKGSYLLAENQELELAIQDMHRHKTHRFYRPNQDNFNDREAATLTWKATDINKYLEEMKIWGYYQDKLDKRRDFDPSTWAQGEAHTRTGALDFQAASLAGTDHRLTYGLHFNRDEGESPDDEQFTWTSWNTGRKEKMAPDSTWDNLGLYLQDEWEVNDDLTLIASGRYDHFDFDSQVDQSYVNYVDTQKAAGNMQAGYDPYADELESKHGEFSGGLGMLYALTENVNLITNYAHGFRLFGPKYGLTLHGEGYRAPHAFLDPIENDTFEVGTKMLYDKFAASVFTFYSSIDNWQTWERGSYNGQTTIDGEDVYVVKTGRARVYGVEVETETNLSLIYDEIPETWSFAAGFAWNYGYDRANDAPMRHTQPARCLLALKWKDEDPKRKGWFELSSDIVRHYDRIADDRLADDRGYKRDPQDGSSPLLRQDGLPGYTTFNVRGGLDLTEDISLTMAVENLTDKKYRRAHSRWDEVGINFLTSLTFRF